MKRIFLSLLCAALILASLSGTVSARQDANTLIVAHQTQLSGNFFSEEFGNNSADMDIQSLIHGYPLSAWTGDGGWLVNRSVVASSNQVVDAQGNATHTFTLQKNLSYSDGSPIKAQDYVFAFLLLDSPQMHEAGATTTSTDFILGYEAYAGSRSKEFTGLRLLDEYAFSVTVDSRYLPYYYDDAQINVSPFPIQVLVPGAQVRDDGLGAYVDGDFSAEVLRQTILNPQTGYLSHPAVTSGPYRLVSYDTQTHEATLEMNPFYKGNHEGQKPSIQRLIMRGIAARDIEEDLRQGRIGLINKVSDGTVINQALNAGIAHVSYLRSGAAFLAFAAERELPSSSKLRQAIAHLIDKNALSDAFLLGHGSPVYGYYGIGQWMAQEKGNELRKLDLYPFGTEAAAALLVEDGWTLDGQGQPYDEHQTQPAGLRYRKTDTGLEPLTLKLAITENNTAATLLADMLTSSGGMIGLGIEISRMPLNALLRQYYRQEARIYDLMFIGSNFNYLFDPFPSYNPGELYQGAYNTTGIADEQLFMLADTLRKTQPGDRAGYLENWMAFQQRWAEVLPMVPLYSNTYYDFFDSALQNYRPDEHWSWGTAILYARLEK